MMAKISYFFKRQNYRSVVVLIVAISLAVQGAQVTATDYSSTNFKVKDPVIDSGQVSSSSTSFGVGQSVSQTAPGKSSSTTFQLWSGYQYFFKAKANVLTATAGDTQVALSWTVPQTFLGISVSSYEVGTGTVSGSYTFENVGAVTSFNKTGLSNGTAYYFIIKAKGPGGVFLAYSNEAIATPSGSAVVSSGGGGGGGVGGGGITFSGFTSPNSTVTLLRDGGIVTSTVANTAGLFSFGSSSQSLGYHTYLIFASDTGGLATSLVSFPLTITSTSQSITDIVLPPTISTSPYQVKKGDSVSISGQAAPNSNVSLKLRTPASFNTTVKAGSDGKYSYLLSTDSLNIGDYFAEGIADLTGLRSSILSKSVLFKVGNETITKPVSPIVCGDFNSDGRINLIDLSILIFWYEKPNPADRVDCNKDRTINLVDFSILVYNWTG